MIRQWPPWSVTSLKAKLDALETVATAPPKNTGDEEVASYLSRFLVVRSCGYLEQVALEVCRAYIAGKSGGLVKAFAHSWLERSRNPSPENLEELVGRFNANLLDEFRELLDRDDQVLRRELSFLVDRRNKIAHGLNEGVGARKAATLKALACEVGDWFVLRLNPNR